MCFSQTFFQIIYCQSQSQKFLFRKKIYIEHQHILTAIHDQDWSMNLPSGSRHGRLLKASGQHFAGSGSISLS